MSIVKARYRWHRGMGERNPALVLLVAVVASVAVSCADSPLEIAHNEALLQVEQSESNHTWRAGASSTWHGYYAPAVTHEVDETSISLCAEWADDYLFTREDGRYAGLDFFSFDISWWVEGASEWSHASVRNATDTRQGCIVLEAAAGDSLELVVKGMARHAASRPTSTHHTVTWHGGIRVGVEPEPADPLAGTKVLYWVDHIASPTDQPDQVLAGLQALVAADLIELTIATSRADLHNRLADDPDVVVHFTQQTGISVNWVPLVNWVQQGNRLVVADVNRNGTILGALQAVAGTGTNGNGATFTDERLAEGVQQPMPLATKGFMNGMFPYYGTFSFGLAPVGEGESVCTFPNGSSCAVLGNEGRTVALGFLADVMPAADGAALIENLLRVVLDS